MSDQQKAEKDAMAGLSQKASLPDPNEDTTVPDVAALFSDSQRDDAVMKAFVAGWFAHARNPDRLTVEDAFRAYRDHVSTPGKATPTSDAGEAS